MPSNPSRPSSSCPTKALFPSARDRRGASMQHFAPIVSVVVLAALLCGTLAGVMASDQPRPTGRPPDTATGVAGAGRGAAGQQGAVGWWRKLSDRSEPCCLSSGTCSQDGCSFSVHCCLAPCMRTASGYGYFLRLVRFAATSRLLFWHVTCAGVLFHYVWAPHAAARSFPLLLRLS